MPSRSTLLLPALLLFSPLRAQSFAHPEPYGGKQAVNWLLEQELKFPQEALDAGLNGEVTVAFKVMPDGTAENVRVQIPLDPACDAEAIRLARMIRWIPASVGGTALEKDHAIAIPFNAKRYKKQQAKAKSCPSMEDPLPADEGFTLYEDKQVDTLATPQIPYGIRGLPNFLANNLKYPPEAFRLDIQGKVTIEFVVETSGSVSNLRTLTHLGGGCEEEAMRLARTICWRPAVKDGRRVRSIMKLDIQFRLDPAQR